MEFSAKQILNETGKKSDSKFPIKNIQSADFDRVGQVRGNKFIFNFGPAIRRVIFYLFAISFFPAVKLHVFGY